MEEVNEYERLRQENILKNRALLKQLQLDAASIGVSKKAVAPARSAPGPARKRAQKKAPEAPIPRRTSSRLAGIPADLKSLKRKADNDNAALQAAERANSIKRARIAGDLSFELKKGLLGDAKGARFEKSFTEEDVEGTSDKDLKSMRERMSGLELYEKFPVKGNFRIAECAQELPRLMPVVVSRSQNLPGTNISPRVSSDS